MPERIPNPKFLATIMQEPFGKVIAALMDYCQRFGIKDGKFFVENIDDFIWAIEIIYQNKPNNNFSEILRQGKCLVDKLLNGGCAGTIKIDELINNLQVIVKDLKDIANS